jgi:hypothetical protein
MRDRTMGFETPIALVGLIALGVPLVLSLRAGRIARRVPFPSVELLRETARASVRRTRRSGALVLAARAGAVAFAAFALSGPYIGPAPPARAPLAAGDIVVLLDRSADWWSPEVFEEARAAALGALEASRPPGRAVLLPFDDLPGPALEGRAARRALETLEPTGRARDVAAALEAASRLLGLADARAAAPRGASIVLVAAAGDTDEVNRLRAPAGARLLVLTCGRAPGPREGPAIVSARIEPTSARGENVAAFRVALRTAGEERAEGRSEGALRLRLYFDDATAPAAEADVPAFGEDRREAEVILEAARPGRHDSLARLEVRGPDGEPRVDPFFVVVPGLRGRRLLLVSPRPERPARDYEAVLRAASALARAGLRPDDAGPGPPRRASFEAAVTSADDLTPGVLSRFDVVCVPDAAAVAPETWVLIGRFVRSGGSCLAFAPNALPEEARSLFGVAEAVGPAAPAEEPLALVAAGGTEGLCGPDRRSLIERAAFSSRLIIAPGACRTLAAFADGRPALVEARSGRGRALLLAAGPGELAERPSVLVPLCDVLFGLALRRPAPPLVFPLEETPAMIPLDLGGPGPPAGRAVAISPSGKRSAVRLVRRTGGGEEAWAVLPCDAPGLWRLLVVTDDIGGSPVAASGERIERVVGVNAARRPDEKGTTSKRRDGGPVSRLRGDVAAVSAAQARRGSREELLTLLEGRGAFSFGAPFAALAFLCLAAELVLSRGTRARAERGRAS